MNFRTKAQEVINIEAKAVSHLITLLDVNFDRACELLLRCQGRIIVLGMGKSGIIGSKLAATLASTGSPAFFVHPGEALHGDMGMIKEDDIIILVSYSGKTEEVLSVIPLLKNLKVPIISITGYPNAPIAKSSDVHLNVHVEQEACPLGLAPTASTTATLAMGDALAIALLEAKGFTREQFALAHPGGNLGKRLLLKVKDFMHTGEQIPLVSPDTPLLEAVVEMSSKRLGMTLVSNAESEILGIFTDGDLRRTLEHHYDQLNLITIKEVMSPHPKEIKENDLASLALDIMETYKITTLVVVNGAGKLAGILHLHDLLQEGL